MGERAATAAQIKRAIEAVKKSGLTIARVEVEGTKVVVFNSTETAKTKSARLLDEWREKQRMREGK